jgi:hypothetical protein
MYVYCVCPAMSKKSANLSDLNKKDRNKRHSSPFINVVKGVFFVVCVTLVPVSYLSAPSAVHNYRVPGKFIRLVRIKQKFIRIAYLYKIHLYSLRNRPEKLAEGSLFCLFLKLVQIKFIFTDNVRILYIYHAISTFAVQICYMNKFLIYSY